MTTDSGGVAQPQTKACQAVPQAKKVENEFYLWRFRKRLSHVKHRKLAVQDKLMWSFPQHQNLWRKNKESTVMKMLCVCAQYSKIKST